MSISGDAQQKTPEQPAQLKLVFHQGGIDQMAFKGPFQPTTT